ncbi:hypothetical protein BKA69DRAFT_1068912 [Paraphysoderma sedebokerense]|nr:hypothetical protein BKA69DRAFT_1068912 [Paraphysoderma sedebokerense]
MVMMVTILNLPVEVLENIIQYLPSRQSLTLQCVCRRFRMIYRPIVLSRLVISMNELSFAFNYLTTERMRDGGVQLCHYVSRLWIRDIVELGWTEEHTALLQHFSELRELKLSGQPTASGYRNADMARIPKLLNRFPSSLRFLDVSHNNLEMLPPNLHDSLERLDCSNNSPDLLIQPTTLPSLLKYLSIRMIGSINIGILGVLPDLPQTLEELDIYNCDVRLPSQLPPNLRRLVCSRCSFTVLPNLPESLQILDCSQMTDLDTLPPLPSSLLSLDCSETGINQLPNLPPSLLELNVSNCGIGNLPTELPPHLKILKCRNDVEPQHGFLRLPNALPDSLVVLDCSHNHFHCLPTPLPSKLQILDCSFNPFMPNLPDPLPPLLQYLNCSNCCAYARFSLPGLPDSLQVLNCSRTNLNSLPDVLPKALRHLDCTENKYFRLPVSLREDYPDLYIVREWIREREMNS